MSHACGNLNKTSGASPSSCHFQPGFGVNFIVVGIAVAVAVSVAGVSGVTVGIAVLVAAGDDVARVEIGDSSAICEVESPAGGSGSGCSSHPLKVKTRENPTKSRIVSRFTKPSSFLLYLFTFIAQ